MSALKVTPAETQSNASRAGLRQHVEMLHCLAEGIAGKLIVASYGENPDTGADIRAKVEHFAPGDVAGMVAATERLSVERHRNVYVPLAVVRPDIALAHKKGKESEIVAVLGLVADFDDPDAANYAKRLPLPADYVLETSPGRFQAFYLFENALPVAKAKPLGERLRAHAGCDSGTVDMSHVWRVPGALNWPNRKKARDGRSREPWRVRVAKEWSGTLTDPAALGRALPPLPVAPVAAASQGDDSEIDINQLPADICELIVDGAPEGDRSEKFHFVVSSLYELGHSAAAITALLAAYPTGIAAKYEGRLGQEVDRVTRKAAAAAVPPFDPMSADDCDGAANWSGPEVWTRLSVIAGKAMSDPAWYARTLGIWDMLDVTGLDAIDRAIKKRVNAMKAAGPSASNTVPASVRFRPKSEAEQDAQPPPEWLIEGVLQRGATAIFYGPENSYKSFVVQDLLLCAGAGIPWAADPDRGIEGFRPVRPLTIVYIAGEGARGLETLRRPAWRNYHNIKHPLPFYTIDEMPRFGQPREVDAVIGAIESIGVRPDIIAIDTVIRAMVGLDENSARDTGIFADACNRIERHFDALAVAVHHSGWDATKPRGSTNLPASFYTRFAVSADRETRTVTIQNQKQKDADSWAEPVLLKGETACVEIDGDLRSSLAFRRYVPPRMLGNTTNTDRLAEVRAALRLCGGDTRLVATTELATSVVARRIETSDTLATRCDNEARAKMIASEARNLQRQAKDGKGGKPGILRSLLASDPKHSQLLWTLPRDPGE